MFKKFYEKYFEEENPKELNQNLRKYEMKKNQESF